MPPDPVPTARHGWSSHHPSETTFPPTPSRIERGLQTHLLPLANTQPPRPPPPPRPAGLSPAGPLLLLPLVTRHLRTANSSLIPWTPVTPGLCTSPNMTPTPISPRGLHHSSAKPLHLQPLHIPLTFLLQPQPGSPSKAPCSPLSGDSFFPTFILLCGMR